MSYHMNCSFRFNDVFVLKIIQSFNLCLCWIFQASASNVQFDPLHNICCVYDEEILKLVVFKEILEFMKGLTNQHLVFQ
ncbi:hypothetical protein Hanom_Chr02g00123801 [Helianthus anomalus]